MSLTLTLLFSLNVANAAKPYSRVICQEYPIEEHKKIAVFEFTTEGLVRDSTASGPSVAGVVKIYDNFLGKNLYQSRTNAIQNYSSNEEIISYLSSPVSTVTGRVHWVTNKYYIFKGTNQATGKDGKKLQDEQWEMNFGLVAQNSANSTLTITSNGTKKTRSFKCRHDEPFTAESAQGALDQKQCGSGTDDGECGSNPTTD